MPAPRPTPEQDVAVTAFGTGEHLVLQAGAGTGKTTTLAMLGDSTPRRGLYIAFNKSIAQEAGRTWWWPTSGRHYGHDHGFGAESDPVAEF